MEDLVQLVFFGLLILFGVLSSRKKKKKPPAARPKPRVQQPRPARPVRERANATAASPGAQSRSVPPRQPAIEPRASAAPVRDQPRDLAQELMQLLQGRVAEPTPPPVRTPPAVQPEPDVEALSLEELEPDRAARHERFHELYVKPPQPTALTRRVASFHRARLELSRKGLRRAFIMKEVLGPPTPRW